ncbi:MAG: aminotransferase class I/II-fold pyridoxal phosphate-dependent enzyme, partial [Chloroflexota bacterium]
RMIIVNAPHNPTGMLPDHATFAGLVAIAEDAGAHLVVDEVYRELEFDPSDRLPAGADAMARGVSIGVMSKSFAMAGLRIGWMATRDRDLLARCSAFKDYTTICSAAPSEILALIGLRASDVILARSRSIVDANLVHLDRFFETWSDRFSWIRPRAGSVGFAALTAPGQSIDDFAAGLVETEGVLLLPGSQLGVAGDHFRIGFGRTDLPQALARLEAYADATLR